MCIQRKVETLPEAVGGGGGGGGAGLPVGLPDVRREPQAEPRHRAQPVPRLGRAVTFVARVHSLGQQHAAQLALGALPVLHLDQVRRHAERVVADLVLVALPDTVEDGRARDVKLGQRKRPELLPASRLSPGCGRDYSTPVSVVPKPGERGQAPLRGTRAKPDVLPGLWVWASAPRPPISGTHEGTAKSEQPRAGGRLPGAVLRSGSRCHWGRRHCCNTEAQPQLPRVPGPGWGSLLTPRPDTQPVTLFRAKSLLGKLWGSPWKNTHLSYRLQVLLGFSCTLGYVSSGYGPRAAFLGDGRQVQAP